MFILKLQEYLTKQKAKQCFVDFKKKKKSYGVGNEEGISEALVRVVLGLYKES